jgi:parallel beta-helix repeat protein
VSYPCPYPPEWRGIRLGETSIRFVVGGQLVGEVPFDGRGREVGLDEVTMAIDDPTWIAEVAPGVFELRATLVQAAGTTLAVRAPRVTTLRLVDLPGVAIAGNRAHGIYEGVTVTSWDERLQTPDANTFDERPHVVYQNASRLDVHGSTFQYLGSDRTASYGVSWRRAGTTGTVTDSVFQYNYFGIYTYDAVNMEILRNTVRFNERYGIDPHDASSGLLVEGNDVYENGSHGIIFSKFVHDSVVRGNFSHGNAGNGIMMDLHSNGNTIEANRVMGNEKEGIVSSASADLVIRRNEVAGSEVGIRLSHDGAEGVRAEQNVLRDVETGIKVYDFASDAVIEGNTIVGASVAGARIDSPGALLRENRVFATPVGVDARSVVVVDGGVIEAEERALDVSPTGNVSLPSGEFTGGEVGIRVERGGVVIRGTPVVRALDPSGGGADEGDALSLVGLLLVASAVALQGAHSVRNRRLPRRALAPAHVRNTS